LFQEAPTLPYFVFKDRGFKYLPAINSRILSVVDAWVLACTLAGRT